MKAEEIKAMRQKACISQYALAALLGTTVVSVNRWERGKSKPSRLYQRELLRVKNGLETYGSEEHEKFRTIPCSPSPSDIVVEDVGSLSEKSV